eukprot:TRINITY_DN4323_c0_g1_i1.p4 TRINITY_DN4323_c0_g1~~TRINITY_DN4323_c0_g1_i1.p4  ORF type:complete len:188 (-),score=40.24 TRINITY_DN4323_c0_g1_i1:709-1272(-)
MVWREQQRWMRSCIVYSDNAALADIQPYSMPANLCKVPYAAKAKSLHEQYEKLVPRMYTPDEFEVSADGHTGLASAVWRQAEINPATSIRFANAGTPRDLHTSSVNNMMGADNATPKKKRRWKSRCDAKDLAGLLRAPSYSGKVPQAHSEWVVVAAAMPARDDEQWDAETSKKHGKTMVKTKVDLSL